MTSVSDNAIIIGIIAVGVFLGTTMAYDKMNLDVSNVSFIMDVLTWIWFIGLLLLVSGTIYKVVKWKSSK